MSCLARSNDIHGDSNFTLGCCFSPDGLCVLTGTASDNMLRLYNTPHEVLNQLRQKEICADDENQTKVDGFKNNVSEDSTKIQPKLDVQVPWQSILSASTGDSVRAYEWYPMMNSREPSTCAFLSTSRDQPIHLIDAYNSSIRASYRPYNALDEMETPLVVKFTADGNRIFSTGFRTDRTIHVFDTCNPGRESEILRLGKTRHSSDGQKGIVSELSFPDNRCNFFSNSHIFAIGTYSPGSIYIYDDRKPCGNPAGTVLHGGMCVVGHGKTHAKKKRQHDELSDNDSIDCEAQKDDDHIPNTRQDLFSSAKSKWYQNRVRGGVTQLTWANDGYLYSASRRSDAIIAWDMRVLSGNSSHPVQGIASYYRDGDSNQRLEFDIDDDGHRLFVGSKDKSLKIYDVKNGNLIKNLDGFSDAVNGVSCLRGEHQCGRKILFSVSSGSRRFNESYHDSSDDEQSEKIVETVPPGALELYSI